MSVRTDDRAATRGRPFRYVDTYSRDPLRKVVTTEPLYRTLVNGVKVQNRYRLTLECGCVVERVVPLPKTATCRDRSHDGH